MNDSENWLPQANARLIEISSWKNGWLDGQGSAALPASVESARRYISAMVTLGYGYPGISLSENGEVTLEWDAGDDSISVDFTANGMIHFHKLNVKTDEWVEIEVPA